MKPLKVKITSVYHNEVDVTTVNSSGKEVMYSDSDINASIRFPYDSSEGSIGEVRIDFTFGFPVSTDHETRKAAMLHHFERIFNQPVEFADDELLLN